MWTNTDNSLWLSQEDATVLLGKLDDESIHLIITDPPWATGGVRKAKNGEYSDKLTVAEMEPVLKHFLAEAKRVLHESGTLAVWLDYRLGPYLAVWGDAYLERVGEIVVHQELGNPGKSAWPIKRSTIYLFARNAKHQRFDINALPTEQRKAPKSGYAGEKRINSVISATMSNTDPERVHYPDQKPSWVYQMLINAYTEPGNLVVDPFCGSGTLGQGAEGTGRIALMGDINPSAISTVVDRFHLAPVNAP